MGIIPPNPQARDMQQVTARLGEFVVRIRDEFFVALNAEQHEENVQRARRALVRGATIQFADGTQQWRDFHRVIGGAQVGAAQFQWRGDRVLHAIIESTRTPEGVVTHEEVGESWRRYG